MVHIIFASSAARIWSSQEERAREIYGSIEARIRDFNSVLYLCFTSLLGISSGCISLSQVRTMKFSKVGASSSPKWERVKLLSSDKV